jgi:hypothetical protein
LTLIDQAVLTLVLGLGLLALGLVKTQYVILSGMVFIFGALVAFPTSEYGHAGWTIISLGLGMYLLAEGGLSLLDDESKGA